MCVCRFVLSAQNWWRKISIGINSSEHFNGDRMQSIQKFSHHLKGEKKENNLFNFVLMMQIDIIDTKPKTISSLFTILNRPIDWDWNRDVIRIFVVRHFDEIPEFYSQKSRKHVLICSVFGNIFKWFRMKKKRNSSDNFEATISQIFRFRFKLLSNISNSVFFTSSENKQNENEVKSSERKEWFVKKGRIQKKKKSKTKCHCLALTHINNKRKFFHFCQAAKRTIKHDDGSF